MPILIEDGDPLLTELDDYLLAENEFQGIGGLTLGGSASVRGSFATYKEFSWKIYSNLSIDKEFSWNTGDQPYYYFRIQSSIPAGSLVAGSSSCTVGQGRDEDFEESLTQSCQMQSITMMVARTPTEVCQRLRDSGWNYPIIRMQRFTVPAGPTINGVPSNDENPLIDVSFCDSQECLEFCLGENDLVIDAEMEFIATEAFFDYEGSGGLNLSGNGLYRKPYSEDGSGGLSLSGSADIRSSVFEDYGDASGIILGGSSEVRCSRWDYTGSGGLTIGTEGIGPYVRDYTGSGGLVLGGEADAYWEVPSLWEMESEFTVDQIEPIYGVNDGEELELASELITNACGCDSLPLGLVLEHGLDRAAVLSNFLLRNGLTLPEKIPLTYNTSTGMWRGNLHYVGLSNDGITKDRWTLLFEWHCTNVIASRNIGSYAWKFVVHALKRNATTNASHDSHIMIVFPPEQICDNANQDYLNFSWSYNTKYNLVSTRSNLAVDVRVYYDDIGLFKSQTWYNNPVVDFNITTAANSVPDFPTQDIKSIFPAGEVIIA